MGNYTDYDLTHNSAHYALMIISPFAGFILWAVFYSIFKVCTLTFRIMFAYFRSLRKGPITSTPKVPIWLKNNSETVWKTSPFQHYKIQCFLNEKQTGYLARTHLGVLPQLRHISSMVYGTKNKFGKLYSNVPVPNSTCTLSIPRKNFKCSLGNYCTAFEPVDGMAMGSRFEFQMLGDDMAQVTYYVQDGHRYMAGICIYAEDANGVGWKIRADRIISMILNPKNHYEPSRNLTEESITIGSSVTGVGEPIVVAKNRVGTVTKFRMANDGKRFESVNCTSHVPEILQQMPDPRPDLTSKSLKVKYCKSLGEPVLIGRIDGKDMHFEWKEWLRTFEMVDCESCKKVEEVPPAYHTLEMARVMAVLSDVQ